MKLRKSAEVGAGGMIEVCFPELPVGENVDVSVTVPDEVEKARPVFGLLKGLITIHDDFDDPIPGFEPYA